MRVNLCILVMLVSLFLLSLFIFNLSVSNDMDILSFNLVFVRNFNACLQ